MQNFLKKTKREVDAERAAILKILLDGGIVEDGGHLAELEELIQGGRRVQKLRVR